VINTCEIKEKRRAREKDYKSEKRARVQRKRLKEIENAHGGDSDVKDANCKKKIVAIHTKIVLKKSLLGKKAILLAAKERGRSGNNKISNVNINNSCNSNSRYSLDDIKLRKQRFLCNLAAPIMRCVHTIVS